MRTHETVSVFLKIPTTNPIGKLHDLYRQAKSCGFVGENLTPDSTSAMLTNPETGTKIELGKSTDFNLMIGISNSLPIDSLFLAIENLITPYKKRMVSEVSVFFVDDRKLTETYRDHMRLSDDFVGTYEFIDSPFYNHKKTGIEVFALGHLSFAKTFETPPVSAEKGLSDIIEFLITSRFLKSLEITIPMK